MSASIWSPGTALATKQNILWITDYPYLADPTGVSSSVSAVQAAIDSLDPGDCLGIPFGSFLIDDRITIDKSITVFGIGYGSELKGSATGTDILLLVQSDTFAAINGLRLYNFRVNANGGGQLDAGIVAINNAVGFVLRDLWIENATRTSGSSGVNGLSFSAGTSGGVGSKGVVEACRIRNCSKAGINWTSESVSAYIAGNLIENIGGNGTAPGIQINGGFNGKLIGNHISNTQGPGIYGTTDSLGNVSRNLIIAKNTIEACGSSSLTQGDGILLTAVGSTGRVIINNNITVDNGTNTNGGSGIYVVGHDNVLITGNLSRNNQYDGIRIQDSNHLTISNNRCSGNNVAAASFAGGIQLRGTCTNVTITGNNCFDDKEVKTQSYGVIFNTGAVLNNLHLANNQLEGNLVGPLLANAGGYPLYISMLGTRQTTNGVAQTLQYFILPDDSAYRISVEALGKKTDGTDRGAYSVGGVFYRNDGGSATQQGATVIPGADIPATAAWGGASFTVSGNTAVARVTGLAATTIDWRAKIEVTSI